VRIPLTKYGTGQMLLYGGAALVAAVLTAVLAVYLTAYFLIASLAFAGALAFVLYFFRDPSRAVPDLPDLVVSPADGRVVEVSEVQENDFLRTRCHKIAIFMSPLDIHVNRAPCRGRAEVIVHRPGSYHNAASEAASSENEAVTMVLAEVHGEHRILVRQVAGLMARRIVCDVREGSLLARGERYGMIKLGSRVDLFVPVESGFEPYVRPGHTVRGGETVLGRFA